MEAAVFSKFSTSFAGVTPQCLSEVYAASAELLYGSIIDCGSGPCKLALHLIRQPNFMHYTGIDYSPEMVALGKELIDRAEEPRFTVRCEDVEALRGEFDCAVCLQSYYAFPNPVKALSRIHESLVHGGRLVLATANENLDIEALLTEASRDWSLNPLWNEYVQHNRAIAANDTACFKSLDNLIGEVRSVGFEVIEAHTQFYNGGLNYIVAEKSAANASMLAAKCLQ